MELSYIASEMAEDFEESIRLGAEAGVHSVALRSKIWSKNLEDLTDGEVERARAVLHRHGSHVSALYSTVGKCPIDDPAVVEKNRGALSRIIELAGRFDTNRIRVFPYQRSGAVEYEPSHLDENIVHIRDLWLPMVHEAEAKGVVLCFEGVGSTLARTAHDFRRVVDALGSSRAVGVVWDLDVAWRDGETPSAGYPFVQGSVADVHVKPNPELPLAGPRESYEQAFRLLSADGYDGPITVEHWRSTEAALGALKQLKPILARLER